MADATSTAPRVEPLVSARLQVLCGAITGVLYYLGFPGVGLWPLGFVAFVPWMVALRGQKPGPAALGGLALGLVIHFTGFYWLISMLQTFSGFPTALCVLFMFVLSCFQGSCFALLGWLHARMSARGWPLGLAFALAFVCQETAFPFLFPFRFGTTLHEVTPLVQLAELGGPALVALMMLSTNWLIAELISAAIMAKRAGQRVSLLELVTRVGRKRTALLAATPLVAALYGVVRIAAVDAAVARAPKVRVGLVQANMGLAEKRIRFDEAVRRHLNLTKKLRVDDKVDLVVWSETSVAGAVEESDAYEHYYRTLTRRLKVPAIVGAVLARPVDDARGHALFNTALLADKKGKIVGRYDKQVLLAFGEYLPFGETFPKLYEISTNSGRFSPGISFEPLRLEGHDIAVFICYEDIIPSFVNTIMKHGNPELLVNMTNDAWFGDTSEPWEHMALSKMRAIEQRRFFVRSTNSGVSGFVDPAGRLIAHTGTFEQASLAAELAWLDGSTPYRLWGESPWWLASLAAVVLSFVRRRRAAASPGPPAPADEPSQL